MDIEHHDIISGCYGPLDNARMAPSFGAVFSELEGSHSGENIGEELYYIMGKFGI